jgi:wee1-like protein kinase
MAMNEVFAHAALMKHKHVVRYFHSWVERGQIYIQNEFCKGGILEQKIQASRASGQFFSEDELQRLLLHIGKGLKYIHIHMDIKPGNILIVLDSDIEAVPLNTSTDSGAASGDASVSFATQLQGVVRYKIGDLGHMVPVQGSDLSPTEGDCRYMAPKFLQMEPVETTHLVKADMYSTGMTLYETASCFLFLATVTTAQSMRNSSEACCPVYPTILRSST